MGKVIGDLMLLAVAVAVFAATFEPLRSRTFKRPLGPGLIAVGRGLAVICAIGSLVLLYFHYGQ